MARTKTVAPKPSLDRPSSPWAAQVIAAKWVEADATLEQWVALLQELARYDQASEQLAAEAGKKVGVRVLIACLAVFGGIFAFVGAANVLPEAALAVAILVLALFVWGVVSAVKWNRVKKGYEGAGLANDFRTLLLPLLSELEEDVSRSARIKLRLDLRGLVPETIVSNRPLQMPPFDKVIETVHRSAWLSLALKLRDKNSLRLSIDNLAIKQERHWKKRSPGKIKYKTKDKWRLISTVSVAMAPDAANFGWDAGRVNQAAQANKLKLEEKGERRVVELVRKFKFKCENQKPDQTPAVYEVLGMVTQVYAMLVPTEPRSG